MICLGVCFGFVEPGLIHFADVSVFHFVDVAVVESVDGADGVGLVWCEGPDEFVVAVCDGTG